MSKFQATLTKEVKSSADYGWELSVTHNGYQWTTISVSMDEALFIAKEIIRVFSNYAYHLEKQLEGNKEEADGETEA